MPPRSPAPEPALAARLAQALGLPEGTPEDAALALVARMAAVPGKMTGKDGEPATALAFESPPDPRRFMPVAAVRSRLSERATTLATMSEDRAAARVADALRRGHISPAKKGWATAKCRSDEPAFDAFLSSVPPAFAHLTQPTHTSGAPPAKAVVQRRGPDLAAAFLLRFGGAELILSEPPREDGTLGQPWSAWTTPARLARSCAYPGVSHGRSPG